MRPILKFPLFSRSLQEGGLRLRVAAAIANLNAHADIVINISDFLCWPLRSDTLLYGGNPKP